MRFGRFDRASGAVQRGGWLMLLVFASIVVGPATAQQTSSTLPSYDVELVIFRHLASNATDEVWGLEASTGERLTIPEDDASPFEAPSSTSGTATQSFPPLPASKFKLTAMEDALRRSRNYQPLAHIGWTQPGFARNAAPFIPVSSLVPGASGLTGQIALSRGRYLHLTLDLTYTAPDGQRYVLRQSRRMRSNERHYIDHPKFGVIAVITPSES